MLVSLELPSAVAAAVQIESARLGVTPSRWLLDRLSDFFGVRPTPAASAVPLILDDNDNTDTQHD